jgi:formyl-CoA transferase
LADNIGRANQADRLDTAIAQWTQTRGLDEVLAIMNEAGVPSGKSFDAADISQDPHYRARDMILNTSLPDGSPIEVPGIVPKLSHTPGQMDRPAPQLGEHTDEILEELGIDHQTRQQWREKGVIG